MPAALNELPADLHGAQLSAGDRRVEEPSLVLREAHEETIHCLLGAAAARNEETVAHLWRIGLVCETVALAAGWTPGDAERLRLAAPMHDIGKIGISEAILQKRDKLTVEEFTRMKQHTVIGARMLAGSKSPVLQLAETLALCHHERWSGGGYPRGLAGKDIPEAARIVAIVDVFDALTHPRAHRPAVSESESLAALQAGAGTQFDPDLVSAFLSQLDRVRDIAARYPDESHDLTAGGERRESKSARVRAAKDNRNAAGDVRFRALIVDDELPIRLLTLRALRGAGFDCSLAGSGSEALALARRTPFDVVITDLRMPVGNGHQLAVELLATPDPPAILVLTGVVEPRLAIDLVARGVDDVLYKPVNYELLGIKASALAKRRADARQAARVVPASGDQGSTNPLVQNANAT